MSARFDVVIVGGRCAGAATALLLARAGARVLVLDKGVYGSDTLSTHALMRGGVLQLQRWGVLPTLVAAGTPAVHSTTFDYESQKVTVAIEPRHGVDALYAPRRKLLDRVLVDAAAAAGVEIEHGVRVEDVRVDEHGRVCGVVAGHRGTIDADLVIGADGLHSHIAARVGAPAVVESRNATAALYSYWEGLTSDEFLWGFRANAAIGIIPTNDGASCVFASVPQPRFQEIRHDVPVAYRRWIRDAMPEIDAKLAGARMVEEIHGFGGHRGFIRRGVGPGWALVGDAGYFKDPLTAHGISDALRDAELLADAVAAGGDDALAEYERRRDALSVELFDTTEAIASLEWDNAGLKSLHRRLSDAMKREVRAMAALFDERGEPARLGA